MSGQLKSLLEGAAKAHAEKQQRERDENFFAWVEYAFKLNEFEKEIFNGEPVAIVDTCLLLVRNDLDAQSAAVFVRCVCNDVHNAGIVKSLDELAKRLNLDERGNLPAACAQSFYCSEPQTAVHRLLSNKVRAIE